jgi:NAD(P)-dependent dehydrogenase (short-subunit alcohol dehydrogenase family)
LDNLHQKGNKIPLSISKKLENRVAVITGATSGMALATAKLFVEEGAYVFITGRGQERLDKAVKEIGRNVTGVQGDAGNLADLDRLFKIVKKEKGYIDVLFASAGVGELNNPLGSITEKGFDDTFNVNVRGTLFTVQKALPLVNDGGSIILNSSISGVKGFPGTSIYSASKAAVRSFARTWTAELKGRNRVNVISPGPIDTAIFDGAPQELKDDFTSIIPMGRMGQPHEIADVALFLASDDSSFIEDHINKVLDLLESSRETIEIYKDTDFMLSSEKTNRILAVLTIWFTLSIPPVIVGTFYGMNINLPGGIEIGAWAFLGTYTTLIIVLVVSARFALAMYMYFLKVGWDK